MTKFFKIIPLLLISLALLNSCGSVKKLKDIRKPVDLRKTPLDPNERARQNVNQGKGISLKGAIGGRGGTNYEFSTSNPMWRATLDSLDFIPLTTVDYSGGLIITDWYTDGNERDESLKITIRFLSNEIQSNSLKIIVHQRRCLSQNNCPTQVIDSTIAEELIKVILTKAATLEKQTKK